MEGVQCVRPGDARKKSGDDYPARIYVAFEFQPDKAGFFERAKRKTVEVMFGESLPGNALNYIWANRLPEQSIVANAFTDQTMMVAVNSGPEQTGEWVTVERDIVADYREAFGENPRALLAWPSCRMRIIPVNGQQRGIGIWCLSSPEWRIEKRPRIGAKHVKRRIGCQWLIIHGRIEGNIFLPSAV